MSNAVAKVSFLQGQAWAQGLDGQLRPLTVGGHLAPGEVLVTAPGTRVLWAGGPAPVPVDAGTDLPNETAWDSSLRVDVLAAPADTPSAPTRSAGDDVPLARVIAWPSPSPSAARDPDAPAPLPNRGPAAPDQALGTREDQPLVGRIAAEDLDGDTLSFTLSHAPAHGTLVLDAATGQFTFTPDADFHGGDRFVVTVSDGTTTTDSTVTIDVTPVNDTPVTRDRQLTTSEDVVLVGSVPGADIDGDTLTFTLATGPAFGTVTLDATTGAFVYTPAADFHGTDRFTVTLGDGHGGVTTSTVTLDVTSVNDTPVAVDQALATSEDTPVQGRIAASDVDGDALAFTLSQAPAFGTVTLDPATGDFVYTPDTDRHGHDQFTVTVSDGHGGTTTSTVAVAVAEVNDTPVTADQNLTTREDTPLHGSVSATDADGDTLSFAIDDAPTSGIVTLDPATGAFTYTPHADFHGSDRFTVTVSDGQGGTTTSTVHVGVTPVNDAPVGRDTFLAVRVDTPANGTLTATDVDGDPLTFAVVAAPANGTVVLNTLTGQYTYTPQAGHAGSDTFLVRVSDGQGGSSLITVTLDVQGNRAPVANDDTVSLDQDTSVTVAVRGNDTDADGDALTVTGVTQGANGSVVIDAVTGNPIYTPNAGFTGTDIFTYAVDDGQGGTATATVTVRVNPSVPSSVDDSLRTGTSTLLQVAEATLLANDTGNGLNIVSAQGAVNGTVTWVPGTNTVQFQPTAGFEGAASFTYTVQDAQGLTSTATAHVAVGAANAPSVVVSRALVANAHGTGGTSVKFPIITTLVDTDGSESLTIKVSGVPTGLSFNAGTNLGGGVWQFVEADLPNLTLNLPGSYTTNATHLTVQVTSTESHGGFTASTSTVVTLKAAYTTVDITTTESGSYTGSSASEYITGGDGNNTINAANGNNIVHSGKGDDSLSAGSGSDVLHGGAGNDTLHGGSGSDRISGGSGNDLLTGGDAGESFVDVFVWSLGDQGTAGTPAVDTIRNFATAAAGSNTAGGDVLDLRDLLQGEHVGPSNGAGNLANYLHFEVSGGSTILHVSHTGGFGADSHSVGGSYSSGSETQQIVLEGVNLQSLYSGATTDQQIITQLLNNNKLITD